MNSSRGKEESSTDHENDLSSILTSNERVELTLLVANISEVMRKKQLDIFDASLLPHNPDPRAQPTPRNPNVQEKTADEVSEEELVAKKLREQREKELSAPKILELKKDSLDFFDMWRESVLGRVGSAVNNSKEVVEEQKASASVAQTDAAPTTEPKVISKFSEFTPGFSFTWTVDIRTSGNRIGHTTARI